MLSLWGAWPLASAGAELDAAGLLADLNAKEPILAEPGEAAAGTTWMESRTGRYALPIPLQGAEPRIGLPNTGSVGWWSAARYVDPNGFELKVDHAPDGSWIKGHTTGLPRAGIESALRAEAAYAKELVDFDPDAFVSDVSLETYRASALYCGKLRGSSVDDVCSLVHVVVHDGSMLRFHSLIIGENPGHRDALVKDFAEVLGGLVVHP
jgi:hypothetical protein